MNMPIRIREHSIFLEGERVNLRPLTEGDWDILIRWNTDPEILFYAEGDDISSYDLQTIQKIYRGVSQKAYCFIIEVDGKAIGEGWLQEMNIDRILKAFPGRDCRRIDLMIGEKNLWGGGLGSDTIRTLTKFGFDIENADIIFGLVGDHNPRSIRAFQKAGYEIINKTKNPLDKKAEYSYDLALEREKYLRTGMPRNR